MKLPDRLKQTSTVTSTATVSLGAAATGFQSVANAIAAGTLTVGDTGVPFCVADASGNWEISTYTITNAATLTREAVQASSNAGAAVTFPAGSKDVFCCLPSKTILAGLLDPADVGFDIVLCAGQSNMEGNPASDPLIDVGDARIYQWANSSADTACYRQIIAGADPLYMPGGARTGKTGPATWFAKTYLASQPGHRMVLLVPVAVGSTGMIGSYWQPGSPGGTYYERAISDTNLAITAALARFPKSRFVGTIWAQGEADGLNSITQQQYADGLKALIAGFRSRITGATNSWFIISSMTPEGITNHPGEAVIDLAHKQVASEVDKCVFVSPVTGMSADVHYTAPGIRIMGTRMGLAVRTALTSVGVAPAPTAASAITLTGPTGGVVSNASTNFTVGVSPSGGTITGTVVVTPSDGGAGGTFAPTTVSLTTASPSGTFTYTPASTGAKTISITNNGGLTNPTNITYTATAAATAPAAPTIGTATAGAGQVSVTFTAGSDGGSAITSHTVTLYKVSDNTAAGSNTGASSPIVVTATNGVAVYAKAKSTNAIGTGAESAASNSVTPAAAGATYATMSPTDKDASITLSGGNLVATGTAAGFKSARANTGKSSGKWYWEAKLTAGTSVMVGVGASTVPLNNFAGSDGPGDSYGYYSTNGNVYNTNANIGTVASYTTNDVIGVALDMTAKTLEFFKNGVSQGVQNFSGAGAGFNDVTTAYPMITTNANGAALTMNFGATAFAYTPPTGYTGLTV